MSDKKYILIDLDHTLSDAAWRDDLIEENSWDIFHSKSIDDKVFKAINWLIEGMNRLGVYIVGITARPEKWRRLTNDWLVMHDIQIEELLMRPDDAFHPAPEIKIKLAKERFGDRLKTDVLFIIDDRDDVIAAFRAEGVTALQAFPVHGGES